MLDTPVYLDAIAYELGDPRDISEIPELAADEGLLEVYRMRGLQLHCVSELAPRELAGSCARQTLARAEVAPADVDVVIYATDHLTSEALYSRPEINHLLGDLGLTRAYPIGVSLAGCANFASGLQLAASLVRTGDAERVLVVIVEKLYGEGTRLLDLGMSVLSDGAVSFLVRKDRGDHEVRRVGRSSRPEMENISIERNMAGFFAATGVGVAAAVEAALAGAGLGREAVRWLFTNNYVPHILQAFAKHTGFTSAQCYLANVPRFGHVFSADTLINLHDCTLAGQVAAGDHCLLLGSSPTSWGAALLRRT